MKNKIRILTPLALAAVLAAAPAEVAKPAPALGGVGAATGATRSLEVGFGIELGEDWISLNGMVQFKGGAGEERVLRIGAFPNVIRHAQKGCALFRALKRAAGCVVRQVLRDWAADGAQEKGR